MTNPGTNPYGSLHSPRAHDQPMPEYFEPNSSRSTLLMSCSFCDLAFNDLTIYNNHVLLFHQKLFDHNQSSLTSHKNPNTILCLQPTDEIRDIASPYLNTDESSYPSFDDVCTPQLDGAIELPSPTESMRTREANYSLNQNKQWRGIQDDANLIDYDVNLNNYEENATIKCSSGFFLQVAKPCFASLAKHYVISCMDVAMTVSDITITYDQNQLEVYRLLHFSLMNHQENLGVVAVHLYITIHKQYKSKVVL